LVYPAVHVAWPPESVLTAITVGGWQHSAIAMGRRFLSSSSAMREYPQIAPEVDHPAGRLGRHMCESSQMCAGEDEFSGDDRSMVAQDRGARRAVHALIDDCILPSILVFSLR
jgi:hypothetical protein